MRDEKRLADLIAVTLAVSSLAGLLMGGGVGLMIGSAMEGTVPVSLLCGLVGLIGGALVGFMISAHNQRETNRRETTFTGSPLPRAQESRARDFRRSVPETFQSLRFHLSVNQAAVRGVAQ